MKRRDINPTLHSISRRKFFQLEPFIARFGDHYQDGTAIREWFYERFSCYDSIDLGSGTVEVLFT